MRKGIVAGAGYRNGINNIPSLSRRYVRHGMHLWVSYIAFGRNIILSLCGREKVCNEEQNREFLEVSLLDTSMDLWKKEAYRYALYVTSPARSPSQSSARGIYNS